MIGMREIFPFYNQFVIISILSIFLSLFLISFFIYLKRKLNYYIKNNILDDVLRANDEIDLIYANKGLQNSVFGLFFSMTAYIMLYIAA